MTRAPSDAGMDHIPEVGNMVERVARALVISRGAAIIASDEHWTKHVSFYHEMCAKYPHYADDHSLVNDAFRDARAAIEAMRDPTPGMLWAHELPHVGPDDLKEFWQAAIDAALRGEG